MKSSHPAWLVRTLVPATAAVALLAGAGALGCARYREGTGQASVLSWTRSWTHSALLSTAEAAEASEAEAHDTAEPDVAPAFAANISPSLNFPPTTNGSVRFFDDEERPLPKTGACPGDMASIDDRYCIDRYEAALVEVLPSGAEQAWPYYLPVEGHVVRAVSQKGVYPQGYISEKQATTACQLSGKRLCKPAEWKKACQGPTPKKFGYADTREVGVCNDNGKSPMGRYFRSDIAAGKAWTWDKMNDPKLNQLEGTLAETGSHEGCTNGYGVHDMVGNIHEWVDDPKGTFQGGYYQDVTQNGDGCSYRTDAHEAWYHDYSTGFRCCSDVGQ